MRQRVRSGGCSDSWAGLRTGKVAAFGLEETQGELIGSVPSSALRGARWPALLFPDALDFFVTTQGRISILPRQGWCHLRRMAPTDAFERRLPIVGPCQERNVRIRDL